MFIKILILPIFIQQIITAETGYRVRLVCRKDESNTLHEQRAQIQMLSAQSAAMATDAVASASGAVPQYDDVPVSNGSAQVGTPMNGAAKNSDDESQPHQPTATPATLNELYQAYPTAKKLVEALDGELI